MSETSQKEYELTYSVKERREDILSDTMSLPFQKIKQFGSTKKNEWENKLILGDNLQVTKYLLKLKKEGKLQNPDGTDGFKLIYIDPPFATKQDFRSNSGQMAYSDKIVGSQFIEFLRKRLILLRELLTPDGCLYVHLDYRKSHYIKTILDEVFEEHNFANEIVWQRTSARSDSKTYNHIHDVIFFYTNSNSFVWNQQFTEYDESYIKSFFHYEDKKGVYRLIYPLLPGKRKGQTGEKWRGIDPNKFEKHWRYTPKTLAKLDKDGLIQWPKKKNGLPGIKKYLEDSKGRSLQSIWTDISPIAGQALEKIGFPTQKPEKLLERIIKVSSNEGDLILDSFCGSGTTLAVAEKLNRCWVGIDSSKFSIYTCQKRMLDLKKEIGNTGKPIKAKPFEIYNAGLYIDGPHLKELDDEEYRNFALELFQAHPEKLVLNGFEMDGILMNSPVHIFPRDGSLTEEYIENLDKEVGKFLKERMFIIVPANRVYFLQDYIQIKGRRYYALRIPYSIIDELHKKKFVRPWQPASETDMNQVIDSVGFDFIHPPEVEAEYNKKSKDELEIKIKKFESVQRTKNPIEFKDKESISMVLIDSDYNGDHFNMTDFFFANQIKDNKWKLSFSNSQNHKNIGVIYIDILGNEKIEVVPISKFKVKKS